MKRRNFLGGFFVGAVSLPATVSAESILSEKEHSGPALIPGSLNLDTSEGESVPQAEVPYDDGFKEFTYATDLANSYQNPGSVLILITDSGEASHSQHEAIVTASKEFPEKSVPLFILPIDSVSSFSEAEEWDPKPGIIIALRNGFLEVRREDILTKEEVVSILDLIRMNEEGLG
jgi:hypothetical protein